jgi:hypothetical protein
MVVPTFVTQALVVDSITVYGTGEERCSHADRDARCPDGQAFNIGTGHGITIMERVKGRDGSASEIVVAERRGLRRGLWGFRIWSVGSRTSARRIVTTTGDAETRDIVEALNDPQSAAAGTTERVFLEAPSGGCQAPSGAVGVPYDTTPRLCGLVASLDGSLIDLNELGRRLADLLRDWGPPGGSCIGFGGGEERDLGRDA